jgi:2',3'-cyclic-nucleotide 2'-phosphodiesterase (5'-nucleotidase family)
MALFKKYFRILAGALVLALALATARAQALPVHILATGDMHGWLQGVSMGAETLGGAAEMLAYWKRVEHYRPQDFLVLSAGDVATGPAISTVYKGVPAVEVMNAMGYDASALGNHEFDFGMDQLKVLGQLAHFPFLSANVLTGQSGEDSLQPSFCVIQKAGVRIGIIGLTTRSLKSIAVTRDIRVTGYVEALRLAAPKARSQGAQLLLVLAHVPLDELEAAAAELGDLEIPLMLGGHSHELAQAREPNSGTWIVNSGEWWRAYSRIDLNYDPSSGSTSLQSSRQVWLRQKKAESDPKLAKLVSRWQAKLDADPAFGRPLGYLASRLDLFWPVSNFVCDAWLEMDPESDIVLNNNGALRQNLEPGPLTRGALVGLLPFNNSMLRLRLSGQQILDRLPRGQGLIGMAGLARQAGSYILSKTKLALDPKASYHVLMNNYMVDTDPALQKADPKPVMVVKDWRDPIEQWLLKHPSSQAQPLEKILDSSPRL